MSSVRKLIIRRQKSSVKQERNVATAIGGRRVTGSGSLPGMKGDVKGDRLLIECKQTSGVRFPLTLALWRKIEGEALRKGKKPVMIIEMAGRSLAVLDYNDFLAVKDEL